MIHSLPGFSAFRWPMRWLLEASAALALLTGFGLHLAYQELSRGRGRGILLAFTGVLSVVLFMRFPSPPNMAMRTTLMMLIWGVGLLGLWYTASASRYNAFLCIAGLWTVTAMLANIPVAQLTLLARMTQLVKDPLPVDKDSQERRPVSGTSRRAGTAQSQGTLALSFPHQFETRTVFGYVYRPPGQSWMQGVDVNGLLYDQSEAVARRFLAPTSTLLASLRVGHVVVSKNNLELAAACEAHRDLQLEYETEFYRVYRHLGFKEPAFFVRDLKRLVERDDIVEMGSRLDLPRQARIGETYSGPVHFSGQGAVQDFQERHGEIRIKADSKDDGFMVITTSYSPPVRYDRWQGSSGSLCQRLFLGAHRSARAARD